MHKYKVMYHISADAQCTTTDYKVVESVLNMKANYFCVQIGCCLSDSALSAKVT